MSSEPENQLEPGITVVVPVWDDYVRFIGEAIESIDGSDTRVLLVDNASSVAVTVPPGAEVVRAPSRLTVGSARNLGLNCVRTKYVLVLDADDKLMPSTLDFLLERMESDPAISVCATEILDSDTGKRHRNPRPFVPSIARFQTAFALLECMWSFVPIQGCALFRTSQAREAGGYPDSDWGDDWVLAMSLAFRGRVEVTQRLGRYYRATPGSLRAERGLKDDLASARLIRERIRRDPGIPGWATALLPLIIMIQAMVVFAVRPAIVGSRRLRGKA